MTQSKQTGLVQEILDKANVRINGSNPWDIQVHDQRFWKVVEQKLNLGAGEAYMDGWWDCERLDELFYRVLRTFNEEKVSVSNALRFVASKLFNLQSIRLSKRVAAQHYDLGNDLYQAMLGPSMAYTCAYYKDAKTLDEAQYAKYDLVCRKLHLQKGETLLDLGCGFGGLSKYAAENYGVNVVAVNISTEQVSFARKSCAGLPVEIFQCDYRDKQTYNKNNIKFDKIASIGLFEHVGLKNYRTLMQVAKQNLKDDGLFLLHTIGNTVRAYIVDPWIDKYIFPGGYLPTVSQITSAAEKIFVVEDLHNFGAYYDPTLMAWAENFNHSWSTLKDKYGERFYRMWVYYLYSCAGDFRSRQDNQLYQTVFSPNGVSGGYQSVR